jgi:hypothetical protein
MTDFREEWDTFPTGYMDLIDALSYMPYIWTIPIFDSTSPNARDPIRSLLGDDDEITQNDPNDGRNAITGY